MNNVTLEATITITNHDSLFAQEIEEDISLANDNKDWAEICRRLIKEAQKEAGLPRPSEKSLQLRRRAIELAENITNSRTKDRIQRFARQY